mmetsp:Transcript_123566/g.214331  ORF Transcript_123566/g.214331 Transcript_123566/m.214331 type:complete len:221 (+) Transcript_123566:400-1062(+)
MGQDPHAGRLVLQRLWSRPDVLTLQVNAHRAVVQLQVLCQCQAEAGLQDTLDEADGWKEVRVGVLGIRQVCLDLELLLGEDLASEIRETLHLIDDLGGGLLFTGVRHMLAGQVDLKGFPLRPGPVDDVICVGENLDVVNLVHVIGIVCQIGKQAVEVLGLTLQKVDEIGRGLNKEAREDNLPLVPVLGAVGQVHKDLLQGLLLVGPPAGEHDPAQYGLVP